MNITRYLIADLCLDPFAYSSLFQFSLYKISLLKHNVIIPISVILISYFFLKETLSIHQIIGAICVVLGGMIALKTNKK